MKQDIFQIAFLPFTKGGNRHEVRWKTEKVGLEIQVRSQSVHILLYPRFWLNCPSSQDEIRQYCLLAVSHQPTWKGAVDQSKTFLTSLAQLDLSYPFGLEDLRGIDAARRVRIKNRVDHIAATSLGGT